LGMFSEYVPYFSCCIIVWLTDWHFWALEWASGQCYSCLFFISITDVYLSKYTHTFGFY